MTRIRRLPQELADQIAAGEIVERPASVVKELLENGLDAGAQRIDCSVEEGGKRSITVKDDGIGMEREELLLALEHHTTSKIFEPEDLGNIETLGFRGEALPSILAVSRTRITTRRDGAEAVVLVSEGGTLLDVNPTAFPRGTRVDVHDLFFNIPARKKFLKSTQTEFSHISNLVTRYALAFLGISFRLEHNGREILMLPSTDSLEDRVHQLFGRALIERLTPLEKESEGVQISGFVSLPQYAEKTRRRQFLFVNRRPVRDRIIGHAIHEAYGRAHRAGQHPAYCLFLDISPVAIDVNVHPRKSEVRFHNPRIIHDLLYETLLETLRDPTQAPAIAPYPVRSTDLSAFREVGTSRSHPPQEPSPSLPLSPEALDSLGVAGTGASLPKPMLDQQPFGLIPLAQYAASFILAEGGDGLYLIDQHVAHERVLFEELWEKTEGGGVPSQGLLEPVPIEVGQVAIQHVREAATVFGELGFDLEPFGSTAMHLTAIPSILRPDRAHAALRELLQELEGSSPLADIQRFRRQIAISCACHAAITINTPLSRDEMEELLWRLQRSKKPLSCPHGRPILVRIGHKALEQIFERC